MVESDLQRTEGPPYRRQSEPRLFCRDSPCSWLWTPRPADREGRTIRWCLPWEREGGMEWGLFISSLSLSPHQQNLNFLLRLRVAVTRRWIAPFWSALLREKHKNFTFHICSKLLCVCVSVCISVSRLTSVCGSQRWRRLRLVRPEQERVSWTLLPTPDTEEQRLMVHCTI